MTGDSDSDSRGSPARQTRIFLAPASSSSSAPAQSSSSSTECLTCKPSPAPPPTGAPSLVRCNAIYKEVEKCMKAHRGNVSPCQDVWEEFRRCHEGGKQ